MKLTKSKLQQIIKEELENIINQSPRLDDKRVKTYVNDLASEYGGSMQSVGETLPHWLQTDEPYNTIKKKLYWLPWDKPVEIKHRLGIITLGPNGEKI